MVSEGVMTPKLTREEREMVQAFETGTLQFPPNRSVILKARREYAAATLRNAQRPPEERTSTPEPE